MGPHALCHHKPSKKEAKTLTSHKLDVGISRVFSSLLPFTVTATDREYVQR